MNNIKNRECKNTGINKNTYFRANKFSYNTEGNETLDES